MGDYTVLVIIGVVAVMLSGIAYVLSARRRDAEDQLHDGQDRPLEEEQAPQGYIVVPLVILCGVLLVLGLCTFCARSDWHGLGLEMLMRSIP